MTGSPLKIALLFVAVVLFIIAALGLPTGRVSLVALGLAALAASLLVA